MRSPLWEEHRDSTRKIGAIAASVTEERAKARSAMPPEDGHIAGKPKPSDRAEVRYSCPCTREDDGAIAPKPLLSSRRLLVPTPNNWIEKPVKRELHSRETEAIAPPKKSILIP